MTAAFTLLEKGNTFYILKYVEKYNNRWTEIREV